MDTGQHEIFEGERLRDEAVERVARAAPGGWMKLAGAVVIRLASTGHAFTTDEVWAALPNCPLEKRAMGAVMLKAKRAGAVVATGRFPNSSRPENHARPVRQWVGVL